MSIHGFTVILPVTLAEGLWSKVAVNRTSDKCGFISVPVVKYGLSWKKNFFYEMPSFDFGLFQQILDYSQINRHESPIILDSKS